VRHELRRAISFHMSTLKPAYRSPFLVTNGSRGLIATVTVLPAAPSARGAAPAVADPLTLRISANPTTVAHLRAPIATG
jgi:hypothetical protein